MDISISLLFSLFLFSLFASPTNAVCYAKYSYCYYDSQCCSNNCHNGYCRMNEGWMWFLISLAILCCICSVLGAIQRKKRREAAMRYYMNQQATTQAVVTTS